MRQQFADINCAQQGVESTVTEVKRELALVEAKAPVPPPPQAGSDRVPDRTQMRITGRAEVALGHRSKKRSGRCSREQTSARTTSLWRRWRVPRSPPGGRYSSQESNYYAAPAGGGMCTPCCCRAAQRESTLDRTPSHGAHGDAHQEGEGCVEQVVSAAHFLSPAAGWRCGSQREAGG